MECGIAVLGFWPVGCSVSARFRPHSQEALTGVGEKAEARQTEFLHESVGDSAGRSSLQCSFRLVVGGPGCRFDYASDHRKRRRRWREGQCVR